MNVDILYEKLKQIFQNEDASTPIPPTPSTSIIVAKPRKSYISAKEILEIFNITKETYNNLLVKNN